MFIPCCYILLFSLTLAFSLFSTVSLQLSVSALIIHTMVKMHTLVSTWTGTAIWFYFISIHIIAYWKMTGVDICTYRIRIGLHYCRNHTLKGVGSLNVLEYYTFLRMLHLRAGDIELNPGPRSDSESLLSDIKNETSDIIKHIFLLVITMYKVQFIKLTSLKLSYQNLMSFQLLKLGLHITLHIQIFK